MEFEIKQTVGFDVEELANIVIGEADEYLYHEPNYEMLDKDQSNALLKAIFSKALENLEKED